MDNELTIRTQEGLLSVAHNFIGQKGGEIVLPPNYDVNSAVKSLYLKMLDTTNKQGIPALSTCTPQSIERCVQKMITKGLDPEKNQCYLIVRGNSLDLHIGSYGNMKQARSVMRIRINSKVIRQGDEVEIETRPNATMVIHHKTKWENVDKPITGAYAVGVNLDTGEIDDSDYMSITDIKTSWSHSSSTEMKVHKEFPHEMARKTVESRLAKRYINTSDDSNKIQVTDGEGKEITAENLYDYTKPIDIENINDEIVIDDSVVEQTATEEQERSIEDLPDIEDKQLQCSKCGAKVTQRVAEFSKDKFNDILCMKCQKENK